MPLTRSLHALTLLLGLGLGGGLSGCGAKQTKVQCLDDLECGPGAACMTGICLPRATGRSLAVEILPRSDSSSAHTGIPSVELGAVSIELRAEEKAVAKGQLDVLEGDQYSPKAHVVAITPALIPGQADMQLETDLAGFNFELSVAKNLVGSLATIWLIPDAQAPGQPPIPFTARLDEMLRLTFPGTVQMTTVRGVLHDSLDAPAAGFSARAFAGSNPVSNVAATDDTGQFRVLIAPGSIPAGGADVITIEFTKDNGPRFVTAPLSVAAATAIIPRTFRLPAFIKAAPLRFIVRADDAAALPIRDVTVRFHTEIPALPDGAALPDGVAIYEQEQRTDDNGEIEVSLIPGTASEARNYRITIVPPPDSGYAGRCVPLQPVTIVGNDAQSPYSATFSLQPKVTLQGAVFGNDGAPGMNVNVTATPLGTGTGCLGPTAPISATTSRTGRYQILLDPGTYRLDVDPPTGAPQPRLTQDEGSAVVVGADPITDHDVVLPAGEVVEGVARASDGTTPLVSAGIKFLEVLCQGDTCLGASRIAPALRAQTRTDDDGLFRVVLPLP